MKNILAILLLFVGFAFGQDSGPQIPLGGSIGVKGSVAILGSASFAIADSNHTLTANEYASNFLLVTSSVSLTATRNLVAPLNVGQQFTIKNATTGGQSIQIIGATGTGVIVTNGQTASVTSDGTNYFGSASSAGSLGNLQINNGSGGLGALANVAAGSQVVSNLAGNGFVAQPKPIYDVRDKGFVDDNSTDNTAAATALIAAIGSTPATIQFPVSTTGKYKLGIMTFPANTTLDFSAGGSLSPVTSSTPPGVGAFVKGAGTVNATTPTNSCSVTLSGTTAGNTIVYMGQLYIGDSINRSMGSPSDGSNTYGYIGSNTNTASTSYSFMAPNIAGGSVTISASIATDSTDQVNMCFAYEVSGLGPLPSAHMAGNADIGGSTLSSGPTTITSGSFLIGFGGQPYFNETCTAGAGYTQPSGSAGSVGGQTQSGWLSGLGESLCSEYLASSAGGATSITQTVGTPMTPAGNASGKWLYSLIYLAPGSAKITILGQIVNPNTHQIFYNALGGAEGVFDFTGGAMLQPIYPEWWGASPQASAATNTPAIQASVWAAFGCGPVQCRTNPSGLSKYNRELHFSGEYQINGAIQLYHVNSFLMTGAGKSRSGFNQTAANTSIFDGQNVAYGTISNLAFSTDASQDSSHPLIDLDAGQQGADIYNQFITFQDDLFNGNYAADYGVLINPRGSSNGNNINFYNVAAENFLIAAAQSGSSSAPCYNCLDNLWVGGDVQGCLQYGLATYYGQWIVRDTTFENGGLSQTGYDIYADGASSAPTIIDDVRSESMHLVAGSRIVIKDSALEQNFAGTWDQRTLAGTAATVGDVRTGDSWTGDGAYYEVTVPGTWGGLNSTNATSGSPTTIVCSGCSWTTNAYAGMHVGIIGGTGSGYYGIAASNTATTITVGSWTTNIPATYLFSYSFVPPPPDSTSVFVVEPNWGTQTTSGGVTFMAVPGYAVDGIGGSPAVVDIQNSIFYGLQINAQGNFRNVDVSRPDWLKVGAQQAQFLEAYPLGETTNVRVYLPFNGGWIFQGNPQMWSTPLGGGFSGASQWNITAPAVWSCSNSRAGGVPCKDVWIGGRSDPGSTNSVSRGILETGGTLGRPTPSGVDKNGTDLNIQGGLPTGAGTPGVVNFWTGNVGSTGSAIIDGTQRWQITAAGHLFAYADNAYDIGNTANNRPRNLNLAGAANVAGAVNVDGSVTTAGNVALGISVGSIVQVAHNTQAADTCAVTLSGTTAGNALVVIGSTYANAALNSISGGGLTWTTARALEGNSRAHSGAYVVSNIPGGSVTVTLAYSINPSYPTCYIAELSGINQVSPIDGSGSGNLPTLASLDSGAATTTATDFLIGYGYDGDNVNTYTAGSGYTIPTNGQANDGGDGTSSFIEGENGVAADSPHATISGGVTSHTYVGVIALKLALGDVGFSRISPGIACIGNGALGDCSGTFNAATNTTGGLFGTSRAGSSAVCETAGAPTTLATGATTTDTGLNCLPANSVIDAVVARVTTTITSACTGWELGDASTPARFSSNNTTLTSGTVTDAAHIGTFNNTGIASATTGTWQASAAKVRITCAGGNPGAGAVRVIVFYHTWTAPTS